MFTFNFRRRLLVRSFLLLLITGLFSFQGFSMAEGIVSDIKKIRRSNADANIDVSEVVKKYISVAADKNGVESYLRAQKFQLHNQPLTSDGTQTLVAVYSDRYLNIGFHDEIRVIVVFIDNKVVSTNGKLIFRSL